MQVPETIVRHSGWTYGIETSPDLENWTLLRELPRAGAVTEFKNEEIPNPRQRFYRVQSR